MKSTIQLETIRENERKSHIEIYSNNALYEKNGWLSKPIRTVTKLFPYFENYTQIRVLDIGCGVGRNCISIAQKFKDVVCTIDCVDILDLAVEKLNENAKHYGVAKNIHGIVAPIENYSISAKEYDWILAVSALEHIDTKTSFIRKLEEIKNGLRNNGIVCLIINSSIQEFDKLTGMEVPAQFEVNFSTSELQVLLKDMFTEWEIITSTVRQQRYEIPRENGICNLHTNVVTFVARK